MSVKDKANKPRGKPFPKGNKFGKNQKGKRKLDPDVLLIRNEVSQKVIQTAGYLLHLPYDEVKKISLDDKEPILMSTFASLLVMGKLKSDPARINTVLDRVIGRAQEFVNIKGHITKENVYASLSDEELKKRREKLLADLAEVEGREVCQSKTEQS